MAEPTPKRPRTENGDENKNDTPLMKSVDVKHILNLTPHDVNIYMTTTDDAPVVKIKASGSKLLLTTGYTAKVGNLTIDTGEDGLMHVPLSSGVPSHTQGVFLSSVDFEDAGDGNMVTVHRQLHGEDEIVDFMSSNDHTVWIVGNLTAGTPAAARLAKRMGVTLVAPSMDPVTVVRNEAGSVCGCTQLCAYDH